MPRAWPTAEIAVGLEPNAAAPGRARRRSALGWSPRQAIEPLQTAMRLSPFDPMIPLWLHFTARAHYWSHDYHASIAVASQMRQSFPGFRQTVQHPDRGTGSGGSRAGRAGGDGRCAGALRRRFRALMSLPLQELRELRPQDRAHLIEGFEKAGVGQK